MTIVRNIALAIFLILALGGCAAPPSSYSGGGYGYGGYPAAPLSSHPAMQHPAHSQPVYPAQLNAGRRWVVNTSNPLSRFHFNSGAAGPGVHPATLEPDGRWNIGGFVQADPPIIVGGGTPVTTLGVPGGGEMGGQVTLLGGMTPDTAARLLAELDRRENPCTSGGRTYRVSIGAAIGAIAGAVINGGRGAVVGALIGALGGNAEAGWSCEAYSATRASLQAVLDEAKARCRDELHQREVNGVLSSTKTRDCSAMEMKDFERIGQPNPRAPSHVVAPPPLPPVLPPTPLPPPTVKSRAPDGYSYSGMPLPPRPPK